MIEHSALARTSDKPIPTYLVTKVLWEQGLDLPSDLGQLAMAHDFSAAAGQFVLSATEDGQTSAVLFGLGDGQDALGVAALSAKLKGGDYQIAETGGLTRAQIAAGWSDGAYRFDRYLKSDKTPPRLVVGASAESDAILREAIAIDRLRDMVNTPAEDMTPKHIAGLASDVGKSHGASIKVIEGDALLEENYPLIHAVGRAGPVAPHFVELSWGEEDGPELAIVGKGVSFDTGGLNLKTGNYMRLMKKDMGGAAHALALADLVMGAQLPVRLKLYIPTVENAISGHAFRPGDVLSSRKGLSVEIDNTDAEGRLILADALTRACESAPDLLIDFATLTGAARVALGPDLAPFYTDDEAIAEAISEAVHTSGDPAWRMPLWDPYGAMLKSPIADLVNSASSGFAGSITAALFLKQFVETSSWVHLDVWAWREGKYGRPAGGAACGLRAVWQMLQTRYS